MPYKNRDPSVYRSLGHNDIYIFEVGNKHVARKVNRSIKGIAQIAAVHILNNKLEIEPYPIPHVLHANIIGWPDTKDEQMSVATELASKSKLVLSEELKGHP